MAGKRFSSKIVPLAQFRTCGTVLNTLHPASDTRHPAPGLIPVIFTPKQFIADGGIKVFVGELNQVYFKIGTANN